MIISHVRLFMVISPVTIIADSTSCLNALLGAILVNTRDKFHISAHPCTTLCIIANFHTRKTPFSVFLTKQVSSACHGYIKMHIENDFWWVHKLKLKYCIQLALKKNPIYLDFKLYGTKANARCSFFLCQVTIL